jgi:cellulose biosynthesis protein BcsQ
VTCDYLALVGVKQVLRTIKDVERHLGHAVRVSAVLPTFYDGRTRLAARCSRRCRATSSRSASSRSA